MKSTLWFVWVLGSMVLGSMVSVQTYASDIYKCVDKNGSITYTDQACPAQQQQTLIVKDGASEPKLDIELSESKPQTTPQGQPRSQTAKPVSSEPNTEIVSMQNFIDYLSTISAAVLTVIFLLPLVLAFLLGSLHTRTDGHLPPWKYMYSSLVYLVCVPGTLAMLLCAYALLFLQQNFLQVNVFVYFVPVLSMLGTLVIIAKKTSLRRIPGVDRIGALLLIMLISMGVALAINKLRVLVVFHGSIWVLVGIAVGCFVLLKIATYFVFRERRDDTGWEE